MGTSDPQSQHMRRSAGVIQSVRAREIRRAAVAAGLLAFLTGTSASGQPSPGALGAVKGSVVTADKKPLANAHISVVGTALATASDSGGTFRIVALPLGPQIIEAKVLGYMTLSLPIEVAPGSEAAVQMTLVAVPVPLQTVKVTADTMSLPEIRGFLGRKGRGSGTFYTGEDIGRMGARIFTDVLRRVPGMKIEPREGSFGSTYSVQSYRNEGANGGRGCQMVYYVNGVPLSILGDIEINRFIAPGEVAAVEIYTGASQIPPEFNSASVNSHCGVVVIWTRIRTASK